ncbi:MAG: hypothetical protein NTX65_08025 [Ignavibacteriales bacterium]|nr:hypothetical protein [Ignavibacteriales bacterium]
MKIECKEIQEFLYSQKNGGDDPGKWELILRHVNNCTECNNLYEKIMKADDLIERIKRTNHRFDFEENLTRSIIKQITAEEDSYPETIFDHFIELISSRSVKFALTMILLLSTLSFVVMEYSDTKQIISLEQKIGNRFDQKMVYAGVIQQEERVLKFFYDAYKLINGKSSYMEINKELVLMKRKDLIALFDDYGKLDDATKIRLEELRTQFYKDTSFVRSSGFTNNEIISLRKEVERLTKELEQRNK